MLENKILGWLVPIWAEADGNVISSIAIDEIFNSSSISFWRNDIDAVSISTVKFAEGK